MAGGTWQVQNKVRPGVYINFKSQAQQGVTVGDRGTVAFPAPLPWGKNGVITLEAESFMEDSLKLIGFYPTDPRIRHITAAISHANKVLIYRLGATGATKASAAIGNLTATAKYGGLRGNDLQIAIQSNIDLPGTFTVNTILDGETVASQVAATADQVVSNDFVDFAGTGALAATAGTPLENGTAGTGGMGEWTDAFTAFESETFNVLGIPTDDSSVKQLAVAFTKRLREDEGKKFQTVLYNYPQSDYEGVISLKNSVVTSDGLTVDPIYLLWEIAAMEAAANVNESLTYAIISNAVDTNPRYSNSQIIDALQNGELVLTASNGVVRIEQDINTLTTYTVDRSKAFSKNRVVRTLDAIANDLKSNFETNFIGKVNNDADGRNLYKASVIAYLDTLQGLGAIQNFDSQNDIDVLPGNDADSVIANLAIQPTDSMEKLYMTVTVR
ncbi:phage tail sheath protein [Paenibacillus oralis]|uniref:Phage tail sheath protein n=1 Tax=Paenibacillus oralis TaxID=2490856 RepID=A0A3P3U1G4_9BACL|nr:phage tail sheath family protein [Paenibacillus oralis]RRJ62403.1 phage tail sheath protein [Paenibacillus oralis]